MKEVPDERIKCEGEDRTTAWASLFNAREDVEPGVDPSSQSEDDAVLVVQGLERLDDVGGDAVSCQGLPHVNVAEAREGRLDVEANQGNRGFGVRDLA